MNNNELYHFGVKGMKWGVRRQIKKEAKTIQKNLNSYQKKAARTVGDSYVLSDEKEWLQNKYIRAVNKNKIEKAQKYLKQSKIIDEKLSELQKTYDKNTELINKTKKLISKNSNMVMYDVRSGVVNGTNVNGAQISTNYDKTKVKINNKRNNKKMNRRKNIQNQGYTINETKYYVY